MKLHRVLFLIGLMLCAQAQAAVLDVDVKDAQETITLNVKNASEHKVFSVPRPDRLVVDVPSVHGHPSVALPSDYNGKLLKAARFGQFSPTTSRFVFDLAQPVKVLGIDVNDGQLTIGIAAAEEKAIPAPKPKTEIPPPAPQKTDKPKKEKKQAAKPAKKPEKPMIVIDPGHGGVDPGTNGDTIYEKNLVLAYAKALKARLLKSGDYRVMLTRDTDKFIVLRQRVVIARKAGAAMFISLHADSAPEDNASGLSVYTVSEKASDQEAELLAARENKADVLAGVDLASERDDVAGILISLAERDTKNRSATLADLLVTRLQDKVDLLSNAHRFAGFAVLKAPDVPSVLVEIGFLSNPDEEKLLKSKNYRDKVVTGIADGVDAYFRLERKLGAP